MTKRPVDDATGEIITQGRSFEIGLYYGDDIPQQSMDFENIDDLLRVIRIALTKTRASPPLQIVVRSWEHISDPYTSWLKENQ